MRFAAFARYRDALVLLSGLALLVLYATITFPSAEWLSGGGQIGWGLDASWMWGLNLFDGRSSVYGRDVIFTYGPLGYLLRPLDVKSHIAQSFAVWATAQIFIVALGYFFLIRTRRLVPLLLFVLGYYGLAVCNPERDQRLVAVLLIAAALACELRSCVLAYCCFAFAAPMLLMKFTGGINAAAIALVLGLLWRWKHRSWEVLIRGAVFYALTMFVCTCFFLGGPSGFLPFLQLSTEIATGYNGAMFNAGPGSDIFAAIGTLAVLFSGLFWLGLRRSRFACLLLLVAIPSALAFKHAFVRHDLGHVPFVFQIAILGLCIALLFSWTLLELAWSVSTYVLTLSVFLFLSGTDNRHSAEQRLWDPLKGRDLRRALNTVFHWERELGKFRTATQSAIAADHLPDDLMSTLGTDHSVMILPWEISFCVANHISCVPYPTLQTYSTYTTALDQWTANRIRGYRNIYIMTGVEAFDGRQMLWDCPITWQTILEGWKVDRVSSALARELVLLKQRDDVLRSVELPIEETSATVGDWISVPNRSPWLRAHVNLRERWIGRIRRLLLRPRIATMEIRYASGRMDSFRLVPDTARDGIWIGSAPRTAADLVQWFEGTSTADPVIAMRVSGPASPDLEPNYHVIWSAFKFVDR